jgi:preprotein translocase subunit YajC
MEWWVLYFLLGFSALSLIIPLLIVAILFYLIYNRIEEKKKENFENRQN